MISLRSPLLWRWQSQLAPSDLGCCLPATLSTFPSVPLGIPATLSLCIDYLNKGHLSLSSLLYIIPTYQPCLSFRTQLKHCFCGLSKTTTTHTSCIHCHTAVCVCEHMYTLPLIGWAKGGPNTDELIVFTPWLIYGAIRFLWILVGSPILAQSLVHCPYSLAWVQQERLLNEWWIHENCSSV